MVIPIPLLRRFYVTGSLRNREQGFEFRLKNVVAPTTVLSLGPLEVDGQVYSPNLVTLTRRKPRQGSSITTRSPFPLLLGKEVIISVTGDRLGAGQHNVVVRALTREIGPVVIDISESLGMVSAREVQS